MFKKGLDSKFFLLPPILATSFSQNFRLYAEVRVSASEKRRFQSMPLTPVKNCELLIGDLFKIRFPFDGYETILIV